MSSEQKEEGEKNIKIFQIKQQNYLKQQHEKYEWSGTAEAIKYY